MKEREKGEQKVSIMNKSEEKMSTIINRESEVMYLLTCDTCRHVSGVRKSAAGEHNEAR